MPTVDAKILDESVLVNMLVPKSSATFEQYKKNIFWGENSGQNNFNFNSFFSFK